VRCVWRNFTDTLLIGVKKFIYEVFGYSQQRAFLLSKEFWCICCKKNLSKM